MEREGRGIGGGGERERNFRWFNIVLNFLPIEHWRGGIGYHRSMLLQNSNISDEETEMYKPLSWLSMSV